MSSEADVERLIVSLEARLTDFERNMMKAAGISRTQFNAIRKNSRSATRQMEEDMMRSTARINQALATTSARIGEYGKAAFAGFIGGLTAGGLAGVVGRLGDVAHGIAEIGDEARRAGLSNKAFQELGFVAQQNRIEVDALTDGMKELSLRADEYIATGKGSAAESFQRLGYTVDQLKVKLADPAALFTEIIGKLGQLDKAAQIRIADELFGGTGGEKFVQLIAQGEQGIRDQIAAAHDLGAVLDDDIIQQAAEIDRQFGEISKTISSWVQPRVIRFLEDVLSLMDRVRPLEAQTDSSLDSKLLDIGKQRLEIENKIRGLQNGDIKPDDGLFGTSWGQSSTTEMIDDLRKQDAVLAEHEKQVMAVVEARQKAAETQLPEVTIPSRGYTVPSSGGAKPIKKTADDAFNEDIQALRDRIAAMKEEQATIGATFFEQQKRQVQLELEKQALHDVQEAARRKGDADWRNVQLSEDQRKAIDKVSTAYAEQAEQLRQAQAAQELREDVVRAGIDGVRNALEDGKITLKEWGDIGISVLDKFIDKIETDLVDAITQANSAGGGGGLFSSILGLFGGGSFGTVSGFADMLGIGARANGGPVSAGQPYIVGERRSELFVPDQTGTILPYVPQVSGGGSSGQQSVHVTVGVSVDRSGNLQAYVKDVAQGEAASATRQGLDTFDRGLPDKIAAYDADKRARR
jgi:hypothetical protein